MDILDAVAASDVDLEEKYGRDIISYEPLITDNRTKELLDTIWNAYGSLSGFQLSEIMHKQGTPWWTIWCEQDGAHRRGAVIPNKLIEDYYTNLIAHSADGNKK